MVGRQGLGSEVCHHSKSWTRLHLRQLLATTNPATMPSTISCNLASAMLMDAGPCFPDFERIGEPRRNVITHRSSAKRFLSMDISNKETPHAVIWKVTQDGYSRDLVQKEVSLRK